MSDATSPQVRSTPEARRPRRILSRIALALALVLGAMVGGCGDDDSSSTTTTARGDGSEAADAGALDGELTVFAAASLTESFEDLDESMTTSAPDLHLTLSFAGSQDLVQQIQQGAPADVFASADEKSMKALEDAGLVEEPQIFARNELAVAVEPGNPKDIASLDDLARDDVTLVLADPSVPVGRYSEQVLDDAGVDVDPASLELDVKATLAKVTSGEADAAIVYTTDVTAAGDAAEGVELPDDQNAVAVYPVAVVKGTDDEEAAEAFIDVLVDGAGQEALQARGFLPPE